MITGSIDKTLTPGIYLVRDHAGKLHRAVSVDLYRRGDRVTVVDGAIVGPAGATAPTRIYEV
jgi:hypothetical protein